MSTTTVLPAAGLVKVPLLGLRNGLVLPFSVYLCTGKNRAPVLFADAGTALDLPRLERLASSGVTVFLVPASQVGLFYESLEEDLDSALMDPGRPLEERCECLQSVVTHAAESLLKQRPDPARVARVGRIIESAVRMAGEERQAIQTLRRLTQGSANLAEHSVNTALYALGVGFVLHRTDQRAISRLALAAVLHDVGRIPDTPGEPDLPQGTPLAGEGGAVPDFTHTRRGATMLAELDLPEEVVKAAEQHHERLDGSGAPEGLAGSEIEPAAQAVAMVNVFDHIRTQHLGFLGVYETFRVLLESFQGCFSQEILEAFLRTFAPERS